MAPPGNHVLVQEKPAREHYRRCCLIYAWETAAERVTDTVTFLPTKVAMPKTSSADATIAATRELIHALANPFPASPLSHIGNEELAALDQLAKIFASHAPAQLPRIPVPHIAAAPAPRVATTSPPIYETATINPNCCRRLAKKSHGQTVNTIPPRPNLIANLACATPVLPVPTTTTPDKPVQSFLHVTNSIVDPLTGVSIEYAQLVKGPDKAKWIHSCANEVGRVANGVGTRMPSGSNSIRFIKHTYLPTDCRPTYLRIDVGIKEPKAEHKRVRFTVGGDLIDCQSTPTADPTTTEILFNNLFFTPSATFMTTDAKYFYLNTPMDRHENMRIPVHVIPDEIMLQFYLSALFHRHVLVEINKDMYGLPKPAESLTSVSSSTSPSTDAAPTNTQAAIQFGRQHAEHFMSATLC